MRWNASLVLEKPLFSGEPAQCIELARQAGMWRQTPRGIADDQLALRVRNATSRPHDHGPQSFLRTTDLDGSYIEVVVAIYLANAAQCHEAPTGIHGGVALNQGVENRLLPQCCGMIADAYPWLDAARTGASRTCEEHPAVCIERHNAECVISMVDANLTPVNRWQLDDDLHPWPIRMPWSAFEHAVDNLSADLDRFETLVSNVIQRHHMTNSPDIIRHLLHPES